jgi:peptidoglycan/xylan/chitin deacetylase (PgdA/CDA1 family)
MKLVTIFFDFEAPFLWKGVTKFDLEETTQRIVEILSQFKAKAVFNTCGIIAKNYPKIIRLLHDEGHEIASHGYAHENFLKTSPTKLNEILAKTDSLFQNITGKNPVGIRAPWLAANDQVYRVFETRKYEWTSNRHTPFWTPKSRIILGNTSKMEWLLGQNTYQFKWSFQRKKPYRRGSLIEIPLLSPMDISCIFPFPQVETESPEISLKEAYNVLANHYKRSKKYFNLTFHEHVIGTANRPQLLQNILSFMSKQPDTRYVLPSLTITEQSAEKA